MKKPKTAYILIILLLVLSVIFFLFPFEDIAKNLPVLETFYKNTTLEITTPNGKATVKINGKNYGETPATITELVADEYEVELTRISESGSFYKPHIFNVKLTKNSTSRINMEIGPDDNLHGFIVYYTQDNTTGENKGKLILTSNADNAKAIISSKYEENIPLTNLELNAGEYNVKITAPSFEDLEFPIVIREKQILNVKGYQFPIPVSFDLVENNE